MNRIKYFRQKLGLTVKQLSDKANVATGYLSELENNKENVNPTREVMIKISQALGLTVPEIFFPSEGVDISG